MLIVFRTVLQCKNQAASGIIGIIAFLQSQSGCVQFFNGRTSTYDVYVEVADVVVEGYAGYSVVGRRGITIDKDILVNRGLLGT
jgi:hypothetical protein